MSVISKTNTYTNTSVPSVNPSAPTPELTTNSTDPSDNRAVAGRSIGFVPLMITVSVAFGLLVALAAVSSCCYKLCLGAGKRRKKDDEEEEEKLPDEDPLGIVNGAAAAVGN